MKEKNGNPNKSTHKKLKVLYPFNDYIKIIKEV